jgi:hypothetical protein
MIPEWSQKPDCLTLWNCSKLSLVKRVQSSMKTVSNLNFSLSIKYRTNDWTRWYSKLICRLFAATATIFHCLQSMGSLTHLRKSRKFCRSLNSTLLIPVIIRLFRDKRSRIVQRYIHNSYWCFNADLALHEWMDKWMNDWSIDWLIDWVTDWLTARLIENVLCGRLAQ